MRWRYLQTPTAPSAQVYRGGEYKDIARAESVRRLCFGDAVKREVTRPPLKSIDLDHLGAIALGWECEMLYIAVLLCSTSPANMDIMNAILQSAVTVLCDHTGTGHFRLRMLVFSAQSCPVFRYNLHLFCVFAQISVLMLVHPFQHFR